MESSRRIAPVSVLLSLYSKEVPSFLDDCFASLSQQSVQPAEIVLVLDGPLPDKLMDVIEQWQRRLPLVMVPLPFNMGLGRALNHGLCCCSNELVMRMDTDDICKRERVEKQVGYMEAHPEIVLNGSSIQEVDANSLRPMKRRTVPATLAEIRRWAIWRNPFNHMTVVFRKTAVISAGGYRHRPGMEDYDLWLRMLGNGASASNLPFDLVFARVSPAFLQRRSGMEYMRAEYSLYRLKRSQGFGGPVLASLVFLLRIGTRVLPIVMLAQIYRRLRRK